MAITLSDGTTTIQLHPDLQWADEDNWYPVEQTAQRTITGAVIVSVAARVAGRPITLQPVDENSAWMPRTTIEQIKAWSAIAGKQLTITLRGTDYDVIFRHQDAPAVDATPVVFFANKDAADWYMATLKFMEV